jgi:hypothetical protein
MPEEESPRFRNKYIEKTSFRYPARVSDGIMRMPQSPSIFMSIPKLAAKRRIRAVATHLGNRNCEKKSCWM